MVGVQKIGDPVHHACLPKSMACRCAAVFHVQHTGQGSSIARPAAAVCEEEVCLSGTGADGWAGKVVAASDEAGGGGTVVVLGEFRVNVGCAFGCLWVCKCQRLDQGE